MNSNKKIARSAGFWYLLMAITSPIGLLYVPSRLIVPGNATGTANNIMASESLFRIGIVSCILCQIAFIFLVLALYRILKGVDQQHASLMVALVLVAVPIACFGYVVHSFTFLLFPRYGDIVSSFAAVPEAIGELSMVLWLLIIGAKEQKPALVEAV